MTLPLYSITAECLIRGVAQGACCSRMSLHALQEEGHTDHQVLNIQRARAGTSNQWKAETVGSFPQREL